MNYLYFPEITMSSTLNRAANKPSKSKKHLKTQKIIKRNKPTLSPHICRVCSKSKANIPIFKNASQTYLAREIKCFSGVLIQESDMFPKSICQSCCDLLHGCIKFRDMCQRSDKAFHTALSAQTFVKAEKSTENICSVTDKYTNKEDHKSAIKVEECDNDKEDNEDIYSNEDCDKIKVKEFKSLPTEISKNKEPSIEKVKTKKQFLCDNCGKICPSPAHLRLHMSTHYNIFPFKCDVCPYKGRTKSLLNLHKRTHLDVKPFKCMYCPKTMASIGNIKKHVARVHSTARPFECSICEKRFKVKSDLNKHIDFIHENRGYMECEICNKAFRKKHIRKHLWRIHKIQKVKYLSKVPSYILCSRTPADEELVTMEIVEQNPVV